MVLQTSLYNLSPFLSQSLSLSDLLFLFEENENGPFVGPLHFPSLFYNSKSTPEMSKQQKLDHHQFKFLSRKNNFFFIDMNMGGAIIYYAHAFVSSIHGLSLIYGSRTAHPSALDLIFLSLTRSPSLSIGFFGSFYPRGVEIRRLQAFLQLDSSWVS